MNTQSKFNQRGMTLLELIVVVTVLGVITSMATDFMVNESNQERFEVTKQRIEQIRYALIGDNTRSMNGQPAFSGFIIDNGFAPQHLSALLVPAYCPLSDFYFTQSNCDTAAGSAVWIDNSATWNGPYLKPTAYVSFTDVADGITHQIPMFTDGWGLDFDDHRNFGWNYDATTADIFLQSYGLDGKNDDVLTPTLNYEIDYPDDSVDLDSDLLIRGNEFSGRNLTLTITVTNGLTDPSHTTDKHCLKVSTNSTAEYIDFNVTAPPLVIDTSSYFTGDMGVDIAGQVFFTVYRRTTATDSCNTGAMLAGVTSPSDVIVHNLFTTTTSIDIDINLP